MMLIITIGSLASQLAVYQMESKLKKSNVLKEEIIHLLKQQKGE